MPLCTLSQEDEAGFCGLGISPIPPWEVVEVDDVIDFAGKKPDDPEYQNQPILKGDCIVKIDGKKVKGTTLPELKGMLHGTLDSVMEMTLSRWKPGMRAEYEYTVKIKRHRRHECEVEYVPKENEECFCGLQITESTPHRVVHAGPDDSGAFGNKQSWAPDTLSPCLHSCAAHSLALSLSIFHV